MDCALASRGRAVVSRGHFEIFFVRAFAWIFECIALKIASSFFLIHAHKPSVFTC